MSQEDPVSVGRLILVPALITLGVTILRLVGELQNWPPPLFSRAAGGGFAIVGIVWLPVVFGIYFALKLAGSGAGPSSLGKAFGFTGLGLALMAGGGYFFATSQFSGAKLVAGCLLFAASVVAAHVAWPVLAKSMVAYGYGARIPVVIIAFFAIRGNWGTHYDGGPPNFPEMGFLPKFLFLAVVPQFILWISFTVVAGMLFGAIAAAIARRGKTVAPAT